MKNRTNRRNYKIQIKQFLKTKKKEALTFFFYHVPKKKKKQSKYIQ